jgi:hypothetical protein
VIWIQTPTGSWQICDPQLVTFFVGPGRDRLVDTTGRTQVGSFDQPQLFGGRQVEGYVPHWSTCPHADEYRRRTS